MIFARILSTAGSVRRGFLRAPRRAAQLVAVGGFAVTLAAACGKDPASATNPGTLQRVSGDSQTVVAGAALAAPMVVRVVAENGSPLSGVVVGWALASSALGTLGAPTSTTDAAGEARMDFTAGSSAGKTEISVTSGSLIGVLFTHTVVAGPASALARFSGDGIAAVAGTAVQMVAKVTDSFGNAVSGVVVNWSVGTSGGTLSDASSTSDSAGLARVTFTLGVAPGVYTVRATSGTFTAITFSVTAI